MRVALRPPPAGDRPAILTKEAYVGGPTVGRQDPAAIERTVIWTNRTDDLSAFSGSCYLIRIDSRRLSEV